MSLVNEGDILMVDFPGPGRHPAVVISDQVLINSSTEVVVALVTTRIRGYSVEWPIAGHGLAESVVRCDNLFRGRSSLTALSSAERQRGWHASVVGV